MIIAYIKYCHRELSKVRNEIKLLVKDKKLFLFLVTIVIHESNPKNLKGNNYIIKVLTSISEYKVNCIFIH